MTPASPPHHDGSALYLHDDRGPGDPVRVRVRVPADLGTTAVHVRSVRDGEPSFASAAVVGVENVGAAGDGATWWEGEVALTGSNARYRFLLETQNGPCWLNGAGAWNRDVADRDDFGVTSSDPPPAWLDDAIGYQIFPDRFAGGIDPADRAPAGDWADAAEWDTPVHADGRRAVYQLFRGDLVGVRQHLDHVAHLGADLVYLTPFFPAGSSHRYDASTFDHVDPVLGGDQALAALVDAAHDRGMRVLGDLTTNHSGDQHEWFRAAQGDAAAPEAGFYYFGDHPDDYVGWFDLPSLPKFDLQSADLRSRFLDGPGSVVHKWLAEPFGLDGWRIDVANMTGRLGAVDVNHEVARLIRATIDDGGSDRWLVAEHMYDASADLIDLVGDGWHGVMAYSWFTRPLWSWLARPDAALMGVPGGFTRGGAAGAAATFRDLTAGVPWSAVTASMTLLDSHDTPRFASVARSAEHQLVGVGLLLASVGVPMIFAGDEVGVRGDSSDTGRQPFPWDTSSWDRRVFDVYRRLIACRRGSEALRRGGLRWLYTDLDSMTFVRESAEECVLVHASRGVHGPVELSCADLGLVGDFEVLYGDAPLDVVRDGGRPPYVRLPGHGPAFGMWRFSSPSIRRW